MVVLVCKLGIGMVWKMRDGMKIGVRYDMKNVISIE